jgi:hypothetical protein
MNPIGSNSDKETNQILFDPDWLENNPKKAEAILKKLPAEEQARFLSQLTGKQKLKFLYLSSKSEQVVQILPPEEVYYMVKENGESDSAPILSAVNSEQMQYFFDLEWWKRDRFLPQRALEWILIMNQHNPKKLLDWFLQEELDQVVTLLKSLALIYKNDEMTDSYAGSAGLKHYSPDGVYDFFFLDSKAFEPLKSILKLLRDQYPESFFTIMEASIWYQKEPTEETAYRWRTSRTSFRGIPELEEALEIYSRLDPDAIKELPASEADFLGEYPANPPSYMITNANPKNFFAQCWSFIKNEDRKKIIHWELVYLANKLMVADDLDPGKFEDHRKAIAKSLSFVNLGLEISAKEDTQKGVAILERTWIQPIFQVGFGYLINLKKDALELLQEEGILLNRIISDKDKDILSALTALPIPMVKIIENKYGNLLKDFESLDEIRNTSKFLKKLKFFKRFAKQCLELSDTVFELIFQSKEADSPIEGVSPPALIATALARFALFEKISCEPLSTSAGESFLKLIFIPRVPSIPGEPVQVCDDEIVGDFYAALLDHPMAWTEDDREFLGDLLAQTVQELENQFGMINLKKPINWQYVNILIVQLNLKSGLIN